MHICKLPNFWRNNERSGYAISVPHWKAFFKKFFAFVFRDETRCFYLKMFPNLCWILALNISDKLCKTRFSIQDEVYPPKHHLRFVEIYCTVNGFAKMLKYECFVGPFDSQQLDVNVN